mmetsp:Transcript_45148/g.109952  ORF Transcript_45148/g.109952 Transcript_45148/m.109952 type:complete len:125 (-) Transcript_45148:195-569(-)
MLRPLLLLAALGAALAGMEREVIVAGDGQNYPVPGNTVMVHYTGRLEDGKKFDSSLDRGEPFSFKLGVGEVIKCWDQGVRQMSVGEKAMLTCSPDVAYGARGAGGVIPPNAVLKFEVILLEFKR